MRRFLFLVLLCVYQIPIMHAANYFVDPKNGSNNTGNGTRQKPWRTISIALSTTISRPGPTLQKGDSLFVLPGILNPTPDAEGWPEVFPIQMRNGISVIGVSGQDSTIIDANNSARALNFDSISDTNTTLKGFTIRGGNVDGIYCKNSSFKIRKNKICNNTGSGIYCSSSSPKIIENVIENNQVSPSSVSGGGIYISSGSPRIEKNIIRYNTVIKSFGTTGTVKGAGIGCDSGDPIIVDNDISHNEVNGWDATGGGIYCGSGRPIIKNNRIYLNKSKASFDAWGGGIYCNSTEVKIENNLIANNIIDGWITFDGGGIYCSAKSAILRADTIRSNTGYGLFSRTNFSRVEQLIISKNSKDGLRINGADTVMFNIIESNTGNGIYCNATGAIIQRNTIARNKENGIKIEKTGARIVDNILFGNSSYGVYELSATADPDSCIFNDYFANGTDSVRLYYDEGTTPVTTLPVLHNFVPECKTPWYPTFNSIASNPSFVYLSKDSIDCHLQENSPCIDRGHPHSRLDADGSRADMGAFSTATKCLLGDVNMDKQITPGDALCAFNIFLNKGTPPAGECQNDCAVDAANADCVDPITPGDALIIYDAYMRGIKPPLNCPSTSLLALGKINQQERNLILAPSFSRQGDSLIVTLKLGNPGGVKAFGCDISFPHELLEFVAAQRTQNSPDWIILDATVQSAGSVSIGGFTLDAIRPTAPIALAEIVFLTKQKYPAIIDLQASNLVDDLTGARVTVLAGESGESIPQSFNLCQNYPNPFNPETRIRYQIPRAEWVRIKVFNLLGQEIRILVDEKKEPGSYQVLWNGKNTDGINVVSGVYICTLEAGAFADQIKLTILR